MGKLVGGLCGNLWSTRQGCPSGCPQRRPSAYPRHRFCRSVAESTLMLASPALPSFVGPLVGASRTKRLPPPSIRVGVSPNTTCCIRALRLSQPFKKAPHLNKRFVYEPRPFSGAFTNYEPRNSESRFSPLTVYANSPGPYAACNRAPSGTTPKSRYRHSSTNSCRAKATIPMRRIRLVPPANRRLNHWLNRLPG